MTLIQKSVTINAPVEVAVTKNEHARVGGGHKSWILDFVNGTDRWIDRYQFGMIQRYWQPMHVQQGAGGNLLL